jgi:putative two-component system response regulator
MARDIALTSKRVYKEAFTHDVTCGIVLDESGQHFDPHIVDALIANADEFLATRNRFAESNTLAAA